MLVSTTTPAPGQTTGNFLRLNYLSLFLTTLYQQDIESGQEQVILLVVAGVVTGIGKGGGTGMARGSTREIKKQKDREIFRVYGQRAWFDRFA